MLVHEIAAPSTEPVTPEELHDHARIPDDAEDPLLETYISSARALAETETARQFMPATYELVLDAFPCTDLALPRPPLIEVTQVTYLDEDGNSQTLASSFYSVDAFAGERCGPGLFRLAYGKTWPTTYPVPRSVRIRFRCGYVTGDPEQPNVPAAIKHAIMVAVAESYKNREESIQGTITQAAAMTMSRLLGPFRVLRWE